MFKRSGQLSCIIKIEKKQAKIKFLNKHGTKERNQLKSSFTAKARKPRVTSSFSARAGVMYQLHDYFQLVYMESK